MENNSSQQNLSSIPENPVNQQQTIPTEISTPNIPAPTKNLSNRKKIVLFVVLSIMVLVVISALFIIQTINKKESTQTTTATPTPTPIEEVKSDLSKYDGRFNFSYPKNWHLSSKQDNEEGLETVVLSNYPQLDENISDNSNTPTPGPIKLNIRLEFQFLEVPELGNLPEKNSEDSGDQDNHEDLNVANLKTSKLYGSNQEGDFFVSYTAGPSIQKTLTVYVYYQGLIPSEITQSEMDNIKRTKDWRELKNIFSSINFD